MEPGPMQLHRLHQLKTGPAAPTKKHYLGLGLPPIFVNKAIALHVIYNKKKNECMKENLLITNMWIRKIQLYFIMLLTKLYTNFDFLRYVWNFQTFSVF